MDKLPFPNSIIISPKCHFTTLCFVNVRVSNGSLKKKKPKLLNCANLLSSTSVSSIHRLIRGRSVNKGFIGASFVMLKMGGIEGTTAMSDARTGNMIFESILEEGVFRFDCSADDRNAAFPSISFVDPKVRETPLMSIHKVPSYIPTFECVRGQQIVNIELPLGTSFYGTGEVSGQLERTGKRVSFKYNSDDKDILNMLFYLSELYFLHIL